MSRHRSASRSSARRATRSGGRPYGIRILDALFRPVDIASLVVVRVVFGLLMAALPVKLFVTGDLHALYLDPMVRFKYALFGWAPDPSPGVLRALFVIVSVSGLLVAVGLFYRWAASALFVTWTYIFLQDQTPYQNHEYLACLLAFLLILMPLNRSAAVDARRNAAIRCPTAPAWCLYVFRFQIAVVYIFGGIRKINPDWLRGEPIRTMLHTEAYEHPVVGELFFSEFMVMTFAYGGLLLDLLIVPALLWRPTRLPAFVVAVGFHLTNAWLWDIDIFPWFMIAATLVFFPPDYPRRFLRFLRRSGAPAAEAREHEAPAGGPYRPGQAVLAAFLGGYALAQILIPMRPFLYPGHPLEQHDLLVFSWNMMLRLTSAEVRFMVTDTETGEEWTVASDEVLSPFQLGRQGWPDLMHQAAQYVARRERNAGRAKVSVRMRAVQSVNGRGWQIAYDPGVDFAATPRTLGVKPWVLPFREPYPPDPGPRTAFHRARWRFCKDEGILPFTRAPKSSEVVARVRAWEEAYRAGAAGAPGVPE